jgi:hypothetical protein
VSFRLISAVRAIGQLIHLGQNAFNDHAIAPITIGFDPCLLAKPSGLEFIGLCP